MPAAVVAIGADDPHAVGAVGARGAEPPDGGRAVQFCNALVQRRRAGPRLKVGQLRAILRKILVVAGRPPYFVTGQQEDLRGQTVRAALVRAARTAVLAIRELYLLDCALNIAIKQFQECVVQVRVDVAAFVLVDISALPNTILVDVLHQQPSAVARLIVYRTGLALMNNNKFFG